MLVGSLKELVKFVERTMFRSSVPSAVPEPSVRPRVYSCIHTCGIKEQSGPTTRVLKDHGRCGPMVVPKKPNTAFS